VDLWRYLIGLKVHEVHDLALLYFTNLKVSALRRTKIK
jgi:hypothetical protein